MGNRAINERNARILTALIFVCGFLAVAFDSLLTSSFFKTTLIYALPFLLLLTFLASARFAFAAIFRGRNDIVLIVIGILFNFGAHAYDLLGTYWNIPDLARETNSFARYLLDARGHSLAFVYAYGISTKVLVGLILSFLWIAFVGHRRTIISSIEGFKKEGFTSYLKAALGGENRSWFLFFTPFQLRKRPVVYFKEVQVVSMILISTNIFIWSIWIWRLPETMAFLVGASLFLGGFFAWIMVNYFRSASAPSEPISP